MILINSMQFLRHFLPKRKRFKPKSMHPSANAALQSAMKTG